MSCELKKALQAVQHLAADAAMRRRGLDETTIQWHAFTAELDAYLRVTDLLTQLGERKQTEQRGARLEFAGVGARTL